MGIKGKRCWYCEEKRNEKGEMLGSEILARIYFHGSPFSSVEIYACPICGESVGIPPLPFQKKVEKTIRELQRKGKVVRKLIVKKFAMERWLSQRFLNSLKRRGIEITTI